MQEHINNVKTFMERAGQNVPKKITIPDEKTRLLRAKLVIEEALEMCEALGVAIYPKSEDDRLKSNNDLNFYIDSDNEPNLVEIADAAVDILWVSVSGPMIDIGCVDKLQECVAEVDRSNLSKFIDGHKCPDSGKWIKGPSYSPANIKGIINSEI